MTELFSGTKYPIANLFFPKICEIKKIIKSWMTSEDLLIKNIAIKMMSKFKIYSEEIHGVMTIAIVLNSRYKFKLIEYCFPHIYGD